MTLDPRIGNYDHLRGMLGAELSLVEYGDFECPHCGAAYPVLADLQARFGDQLRFVFRHSAEPGTSSGPAGVPSTGRRTGGTRWGVVRARGG